MFMVVVMVAQQTLLTKTISTAAIGANTQNLKVMSLV